MLEDAELNSSGNDKATKTFVDARIHIKDICYELLVVENSIVSVKRLTCVQDKKELRFSQKSGINRMMEATLYVLKKQVVYLLAFVEYLKCCKVKKEEFANSNFDTAKLDQAMLAFFGFVQQRHYCQALSILLSKSPEDLSHTIDWCSRSKPGETKCWLNELRSLNKFCPCVDKEDLLRFEGRFNNFPDLSKKLNYPLFLLSKNALTRLAVLQYHEDNFPVGVQHILLCTKSDSGLLMGMHCPTLHRSVW